MIKKYCLNFLFLISVLFVSCNMQNVSDSGASLKVALPGKSEKAAVKYTADDIKQYEVVITNEYGKSFVKTGVPGETVSFEHVLTGKYDIDVFALDESGYTGARGSVSASVKENETCNVAITASLLYRSDFFISGADGVWLSNHSDYFINSTFKNYRNDVDFSVTTENSTSEAPAIELIPVTSVRLTNGNIPYIYVNALDTKNSPIFGSEQVTSSVSFEAKSSVPSTVNFYFQDIDHEPIGVVLQAELETDFKEFKMYMPAKNFYTDDQSYSWNGTLRAVVTSGNGTVTIKNVAIDTNAQRGENTPTPIYTCYPPDTKGVKLSSDYSNNSHIFEFTDTNTYGGLAWSQAKPNETADPSENVTYSIYLTSTEENVNITFYRYTLGGGIQQISKEQQIVQTDVPAQITITVPQVETVTEREVCAILFKVDKPTTITIERYIL